MTYLAASKIPPNKAQHVSPKMRRGNIGFCDRLLSNLAAVDNHHLHGLAAPSGMDAVLEPLTAPRGRGDCIAEESTSATLRR